MHCSLAFLLPLLQLLSVCTAAPLPMEVVKVKSNVKQLAEQLLVRLKNFQFPAGRTLSPAAGDLDGLSATVIILDGYNSLISDTLNGVSQIKADISSLTRHLDQWRQGNCSKQRPKPPVPGPLQKLQSHKDLIDTVSFEALLRVKEILGVLLKNLDNLEIC